MPARLFSCVTSVVVAVSFLCGFDHAGAQGCPTVYTFTGETGDHLGASVSDAGDVDNDGYPDVIVGAPAADHGVDTGQAYVYSGLTGLLIWAFAGEEAGDAFGLSVSGAGDFDDDGYADLIVGARLNDAGGIDAGRVYVFSGQTGSLLWMFTGESAGDNFGASVSNVGDFDGDGHGDLIIGATYNGTVGLNAGKAYVYSGQTGTLVQAMIAEAADNRFGWSVSGAGDVNDDGYDDVVIGAYANDAGGFHAGRAYVFLGGTGPFTTPVSAAAADQVFTGEAVYDFFGVSVSGAGDVNNDGFDDVIVGAIWNDAGGGDGGRAYVFYGGLISAPSEVLAEDADWILTAAAAGSEFGGSVAGVGDVNCDGFADVIVGASGSGGMGHAYVFFGGTPSLPHQVVASAADLIFDGEGTTDEFGQVVSGAGDLDRDGCDELIVGAFYNDAGGVDAGRAYVYSCFKNLKPLALCQNVTVSADEDCQAIVLTEDVNDGSYDPDGDPITLSLKPPPPYELGTTPVWLVVEDDKGAKDSCQTDIIVEDNTAPEVTCPGNITTPNDPSQCGAVVTWDPPTATDNCEVDAITCDQPSGSFFPVGTTQVECIAVDASGNADTCTFDVTVEDTEPPVSTCPSDVTVQAAACEACAEVEFVASIDDNCPGATIVCDPPSGFCFPVGTTVVTCIAADAAGNEDTCTFNVIVDPHPCDTLWIGPADIYYGPDGCSVPVNLSNHTGIGGGTIPLTYDPLPTGWTCDSVSYVGSRLEDESYRNIFDSSIVDDVNRSVLVHWAGAICLPEGQGPLFHIWLSNSTCGGGFDADSTPIQIDTATVNNKWFRLPDCGGFPVTATFESGFAELHHYQMSDVMGAGGNPDCIVDVLDVVCLVNMAFRSGDCDWAIPAGDNNCDGFINVLDVVAAINRAFRGWPLQFCGCTLPLTALQRTTPLTAVASLDRTGVTGDRWESTLTLSAPLPWAAAQLEWTLEGGAEDISITVGEGAAGLEPFWHRDGNEMTVGLIDIYGETIIEPGQQTVLHLSGTGEFPGLRLASGLLATQDAEAILISPAELAGTDAVVRPSTFALGDCYPNPFNAGTVIPYTLSENGQVRLEVFDVLGRPVASLIDEIQSAGRYDVAWDGLDDRGQPLASGMYFYRLTAADIAVTKKMVLLK